MKGDGMSARGRRRLRRRVGSALTAKRLGGAKGGRAVEEAWSVWGRGHERWGCGPGKGRGLAGAGARPMGLPAPAKMAAAEVPEALAGGSCNRPRHRPDLPPPLLYVCLK